MKTINEVLSTVMDPEIPVLSVIDLGIISRIEEEPGSVRIWMTPTYNGCPALEIIRRNIAKSVEDAGYGNVEVIVDRVNLWSSDKLSDEARQKLKDFGLGIAPLHGGQVEEADIAKAACPHCGSLNTSLNSPFGSTLCRSYHVCYDCRQKFERFKPV